MLSSMKVFMAQAGIAACLASASVSAAALIPSRAAAQDQEAGDVRVDLPARRKLAEPEPERRTRASVGSPGPLRIYAGFYLAVGGDAQIANNNGYYAYGRSQSLAPTVGFQAGADYILHDYFSIGGETRFLWVKADSNLVTDRDFLWDLDVKPRGRYAFSNIPLEVYGALPIGLTVAGIKGQPEGKPGFNVGLVGGANYWFTSRIAINAEVGWNFHKFGETVNGSPRADIKMNQFVCIPTANFVYSL
ncbi:MAG: hypothetical protein JWN04_2946 [Myxococcaceae bacterium]|nr:hypothetical protein [Myxococcaceae bacterium]